MSEKEYYSSRIIILKGTINKGNNELFLIPLDPNQHIQRLISYLPTAIDNTPWDLMPPNYSMPLGSVREKLQSFVESKFKRKPGYIFTTSNAHLPIIIDSVYIAKGELFSDRSEYILIYEWFLDDQRNKRPKIIFKALVFKEKLNLTSKPSLLLSREWEELVKQLN